MSKALAAIQEFDEEYGGWIDTGIDVVCNIVSAASGWNKVKLILQARRALKVVHFETLGENKSVGKVEFYERRVNQKDSKELHILLEDVSGRPTATGEDFMGPFRTGIPAWPEFGEKTKTSGVVFSAMKHIKTYARDAGFSEFKLLVHDLKFTDTQSALPDFLFSPTLRGGTNPPRGTTQIPPLLNHGYSILERRYGPASPSQIVLHPYGERIVCKSFQIPASASSTSSSTALGGTHSLGRLGPLATSGRAASEAIHARSQLVDPIAIWLDPALKPLQADTLVRLSSTIAPTLQRLASPAPKDVKHNSGGGPQLVLPPMPFVDSRSPNSSFTSRVLSKPPPYTPPAPTPPVQGSLQARVLAKPQIQNTIHTQVVSEMTGSWEAGPNNIQRNNGGGFTITYPDTKEQVHLPASQVPAHIQAVAAPAPPPPPPPPKYCGKIMHAKWKDGFLAPEWTDDRCPSCQSRSGLLGGVFNTGCQRSF